MQRQSAPRGTRDVLPDEGRLRQRVLDVFRARFENAGFGPILTPTFEHTEVFSRAVGDSTDIVTKEMYTFEDRGGRSLSLRPEGTAAVVRAYIEHGMHRLPQPVKLWYFAPMFRYERPQEGRYREHWQLGAEVFGSASATADAELIAVLDAAYRDLGITDLQLRINSLASGSGGVEYRSALVAYLRDHEADIDDDTKRRVTTNPLRAFDSKDPATREVMAGAPTIDAFLSDGERTHFAQVCDLLDAAGVSYMRDPALVRGLDYYTSTVFEFSCARLGAQDAVGGGGRYDRLVEQLGGSSTPAVGFGCGIERVVLALSSEGASPQRDTRPVYVGGADGGVRSAFAVAAALRDDGIEVHLDLMGRAPGRQRKQAGQLRAPIRVECSGEAICVYVFGDDDAREFSSAHEACDFVQSSLARKSPVAAMEES